jgi:hypothetical protein
MDTAGVFKTCEDQQMTCEHTRKVAKAVPAPHWWKQECADCGKWIKWLGKNYKPTNQESGKKRFRPKRKLIADDIGITTYIDALGRERRIGK